ncbi:MAG: CapA family protein [Promethearchaeota archaeon]
MVVKLSIQGDSALSDPKFDKSLFASMEGYLDSHNFNILNLESPVYPKRPFTIRQKALLLGSFKSRISLLSQEKIQIVSLANNHITDFYNQGVNETLKALSNSNIQYFGLSGPGVKNEYIIEQESIRIGLVGFGSTYVSCVPPRGDDFGVEPINVREIKAVITELKSRVTYVLVFLHWGAEYELFPYPYHRKISRLFIDAGAEAIIGIHPHRLQGYETYKGKPIFYSLGNFIISHHNFYNYPYPSYSDYSISVSFEFSPMGIKYSIHPLKFSQTERKLILLEGQQKLKVDRYLTCLNEFFTKPKKLYARYVKVYRPWKIMPFLGESILWSKIKMFFWDQFMRFGNYITPRTKIGQLFEKLKAKMV